MRPRFFVGVLLVVAPLLTLVYTRAQSTGDSPQVDPHAIVQTRSEGTAQLVSPNNSRYSRQRLDALRRSITAQIAVYDAAEGGVREPTPAEAAALALPITESGTAVQMRDGGMALRQNGSALSLLVATTGKDGGVRVAHDTPVKKEVSHDR
jgi:hypothetical protein